MKEIDNIDKAEAMVLDELREVFSHLRIAGQAQPTNLEIGLEIIRNLRRLTYQNINQLQHEGLILRVVRLLGDEFYQSVAMKWFYNPRQGGRRDEPDLRGMDSSEKIRVSAEVTTSDEPQGGIDSRMAGTLKKLSIMPGDK